MHFAKIHTPEDAQPACCLPLAQARSRTVEPAEDVVHVDAENVVEPQPTRFGPSDPSIDRAGRLAAAMAPFPSTSRMQPLGDPTQFGWTWKSNRHTSSAGRRMADSIDLAASTARARASNAGGLHHPSAATILPITQIVAP